ncbi:hypothetical protein [Microscilla marina]|uniref:Uncharacterized protein n=1 Tax=Microscilla marina ATCC 23134 TaxID=313606 RepID=A1ZST1_MICM2|nr:hypothetical protein [Microscilla marina]EAY26495.1 hypothetical protein M23134_01665 [Microscilla marina ATCC 23134]
MRKSTIEREGRVLWQKYDARSTQKFWQSYNHLLAKAKQNRVAKVQTFNPKPPQTILSPLPKRRKTQVTQKVLWLFCCFWLIVGYLWLVSGDTYKNSAVMPPDLHFVHRVGDEVTQEKWLRAMSTPAQRTDLDVFLERNDSIPREEAIDQFIASRGLVDWSQLPINMSVHHQQLYRLFQPGDTSIVCKGNLRQYPLQAIRYDYDTTFFEKPAKPFFRARLILIYKNYPVLVKPEGYYIKTPYQRKAQKVVKGGEKLLQVKLITEQKQ